MKKLLITALLSSPFFISADQKFHHPKEAHFLSINPITDDEACRLKELYIKIYTPNDHKAEGETWISSHILNPLIHAATALSLVGNPNPLSHLDANRINACMNNVHPNKAESTTTAAYLESILMIEEPERLTNDPAQLQNLYAIKHDIDPALLIKAEEAAQIIKSNILIDPEHMPVPTLEQLYFMLYGQTVALETLDGKAIQELKTLQEDILICCTNPYIEGAPDLSRKPNCKKCYKLFKNHENQLIKQADSLRQQAKETHTAAEKKSQEIFNEAQKEVTDFTQVRIQEVEEQTQRDTVALEKQIQHTIDTVKAVSEKEAAQKIAEGQAHIDALKAKAQEEIAQRIAEGKKEAERVSYESKKQAAEFIANAEKLVAQEKRAAQEKAAALLKEEQTYREYGNNINEIATRIRDVQKLSSDNHKNEPHSL